MPASSGWEVLPGCLEVATAWDKRPAGGCASWFLHGSGVYVFETNTMAAAAADLKLPMTLAGKKRIAKKKGGTNFDFFKVKC